MSGQDNSSTPDQGRQSDRTSSGIGLRTRLALRAVRRVAEGFTQGTQSEEANLAARQLEFDGEVDFNPQETVRDPEALLFSDSVSQETPDLTDQQQDLIFNMPTDANTTRGGGGNNGPFDADRHETIAATASDMFITAPRDKSTIRGMMVSVKRSERGDTAKERQRNKSSATLSITNKFGVPAHFIAIANQAGEEAGDMDSNKIQDVFINTALKAQQFHIECTSWDMNNVMLIPTLVDEEGATPADRWDFTKRRHLLDHHGSISMKECTFWTEDCVLSGTTLEIEDQEWILTKARNSSTSELRRRVEMKMEKLPAYQQGGVTYLKIMFDIITYVDDNVISALTKYLTKFKDHGLLKIKGENVSTAKLALLAVCTRLSDSDRLPHDAVNDIIEGLSKVTHSEFKDVFKNFKLTRVNSLLGGAGQISGSKMEQIEQVLEAAETLYNKYSTSGDWNVTQKKAYMNNCFNCGGNHPGGYMKCNKPKDEAKIKKNREEFRKKKDQAGENGAGGKTKTGGNPNKSNAYGKGAYSPPTSGEVVRKIKQRIYCACQKCGWNESHSTKYHDSWVANKANFALPANHPYEIEKVKFNALRGTSNTPNTPSNNESYNARSNQNSTGATNNTGNNSSNSTNSQTGSANRVSFADQANPQGINLFQSLAERAEALERSSTSPEVAGIAGVLKNLFRPAP